MTKILQFILVLTLFCWTTTGVAYGAQVPRFTSLKYNESNVRTGPGERFPIDWVYKEKHYPVEVIDEFEFWRQIREYDGTIGWVHKNLLSSTRYGLILEDCKIYAKPMQNAAIVGLIQKNVLGRIVRCPRQSDFCLMDFETVKGWMHKDNFWGLYPNEIID